MPEQRRRFRFSLRFALLALTAACLLLGCGLVDAFRSRRIESEARAVVVARGGVIVEDGHSRSPLYDDGRLSRTLGIARQVRTLWTVNLSGAALTREDLQTLVRCRWIRSLDISGTPIGDEELKLIAQLPELHTLFASNTKITDKGLDNLNKLRYLAHLDVSSTQVTYDGLRKLDDALGVHRFAAVQALTAAPFPGIAVHIGSEILRQPDDDFGAYAFGKSVRSLHVTDGTKFDPASWAHLSQLSDLRDWSSSFGSRRFPGFENMAKLQALRSLSIDGGLLTDEDIDVIAALPKLRYLSLFGLQNMTDDAVLRLGENTSLKSLQLRGDGITLRVTANLSGLKALEVLSLDIWEKGPSGKYDELSSEQMDKTAAALARLKDVPRLRSLRLWGNVFRPEALAALKDVRQLEELYLAPHPQFTTPAEMMALQRLLPSCRVRTPPISDTIDLD